MSKRHPRQAALPVAVTGEAAGAADLLHPHTVDPEAAERPSRSLEIAVAAVALALGIAGFVLAQNLVLRTETGGVDPRWWPTVLSSCSALMSAVLLAIAIFRPPFDRSDLERTTRSGWTKLALALAIAIAYVALWQVVGYIIATVVFLAAIVFAFGGRRWTSLVVYPIVTTGFTYLLFHTLLKVPL